MILLGSSKNKIFFADYTFFITFAPRRDFWAKIIARPKFIRSICMSVCGGLRGSCNGDAAEENFLCRENLLPTQRKNISRA